MIPLLLMTIGTDRDVVTVRQRARQIAAQVGFDAQDQVRIATAVSEVARNAFVHARGGRVEFMVEGQVRPQVLLIRIADRGSGIRDLDAVLAGKPRAGIAPGQGIMATRRLVDAFEIQSSPEAGTVVSLRKLMPQRAPFFDRDAARALAGCLAQHAPRDPLEEIQAQNQELMRTLEELRRRQDELTQLNHELEDTNRGVVALYAELDEKADHLRRADELKSRFLSNMSHEFRTPLSSILSLTRLLLGRHDGELTGEQETQLRLVRKSAEDLIELVNDLLDLAKVEAGKIKVHPTEFLVTGLFGALRGMLRPLLVSDAVNLVFEDPEDLAPLYTDETKVSQILRNFISNALKFTERGEVRVKAALSEDGKDVIFDVTDTGIGIKPEDQVHIFEEFTQLDSPLQRKVKGTGLGLPLSRKLAELLGGKIGVESQLGAGSRFWVRIPVLFAPPDVAGPLDPACGEADDRPPIVLIEDSAEAVLLYHKFLRGSRYRIVAARTVGEARRAIAATRPRAVVADIVLRGEDTWRLIAELRQDESTRSTPIIVVTEVDDERKAIGLGADAYARKPIDPQWLVATLDQLTGSLSGRVLVVDDDEAARYVVRAALKPLAVAVDEANDGLAGLVRARAQRPDAIVLDMMMPEMNGLDLLMALDAERETQGIPVIVHTAKVLTLPERRRLATRASAIVGKNEPAEALAAAVRAVLTTRIVPSER